MDAPATLAPINGKFMLTLNIIPTLTRTLMLIPYPTCTLNQKPSHYPLPDSLLLEIYISTGAIVAGANVGSPICIANL